MTGSEESEREITCMLMYTPTLFSLPKGCRRKSIRTQHTFRAQI